MNIGHTIIRLWFKQLHRNISNEHKNSSNEHKNSLNEHKNSSNEHKIVQVNKKKFI